jgi:hypothetical protein
MAFIGISAQEDFLSLSNWHRFPDDSTIECRLSCCSKSFMLHKHSFSIDIDHFSAFLPDLKKLYSELKGESVLCFRHERDQVLFKSTELGHIAIYCNAYSFGPISQKTEIGFEIDQTYFPDFIHSLEMIYGKLGY